MLAIRYEAVEMQERSRNSPSYVTYSYPLPLALPGSSRPESKGSLANLGIVGVDLDVSAGGKPQLLPV
jgi:hypothetical protein